MITNYCYRTRSLSPTLLNKSEAHVSTLTSFERCKKCVPDHVYYLPTRGRSILSIGSFYKRIFFLTSLGWVNHGIVHSSNFNPHTQTSMFKILKNKNKKKHPHIPVWLSVYKYTYNGCMLMQQQWSSTWGGAFPDKSTLWSIYHPPPPTKTAPMQSMGMSPCTM